MVRLIYFFRMLLNLYLSNRKGKKWVAIFKDHKPVHFGGIGYEDYTHHKDPERRRLYIERHQKKEDWSNPYKAGTLSRYLLWEYTNLEQAIKEYNKRFFGVT
jgi:hypothetical protein